MPTTDDRRSEPGTYDQALHQGSWRLELAVAALGVLVGLTMALFVLS